MTDHYRQDDLIYRDLEPILIQHQQRYPRSRSQDWLKLLYQNELGGGHLIRDPQASLEHLRQEYDQVAASRLQEKAQNIKPGEPIGNDLCRFHLRDLPDGPDTLATLNRLFVATAASVRGDPGVLQRKLQVLLQAWQDGLILPYSERLQLEHELDAYIRQGCPMQSHSDVYRQAYAPAYRILRPGQARFFSLYAAIDRLLAVKPKVWIAIDGPCGSGKSTLAAELATFYGCDVFHMDDFFLRPEQRTQERRAQPGGNVDRERFATDVLEPLSRDEPFSYRPFDCSVQKLASPVTARPQKLILIEGAYSHHPKLKAPYDLKVFLTIDPEKQRQRILARNGPKLYTRFIEEWIPLEERYFEAFAIRKHSDLIY